MARKTVVPFQTACVSSCIESYDIYDCLDNFLMSLVSLMVKIRLSEQSERGLTQLAFEVKSSLQEQQCCFKLFLLHAELIVWPKLFCLAVMHVTYQCM